MATDPAVQEPAIDERLELAVLADDSYQVATVSGPRDPHGVYGARCDPE
jgi:hypothetical protein